MNSPSTSLFPHKNGLYLFDTSLGNYRLASSSDFGDPSLEIAKENSVGRFFVNVLGENSFVGTVVSDVWGGGRGSTWDFSTGKTLLQSGVYHNITGVSQADSPTGSGAWTLRVDGLNNLFLPVTETITLSGTNLSPLVNSYSIIHEMCVLTAGSGKKNQGDISAIQSGTYIAPLSCVIKTGKNQSFNGFRQVPSGFTAYLLGYTATSNNTGTYSTNIELSTKSSTDNFYIVKEDINLSNSRMSHQEDLSPFPLRFPEKTIIKSSCANSASTVGLSEIGVNLRVLLVANV